MIIYRDVAKAYAREMIERAEKSRLERHARSEHREAKRDDQRTEDARAA